MLPSKPQLTCTAGGRERRRGGREEGGREGRRERRREGEKEGGREGGRERGGRERRREGERGKRYRDSTLKTHLLHEVLFLLTREQQ